MSNRQELLNRLSTESWDIAVVGGGASGLGTALDAASRGFRTVLLEQNDYAKATSSRSTKLIHGGVRYLKQAKVAFVRESLHERGLLLKNAAGLVHPLEFIIPTFSLAERLFYGAGLKVYDLLAGKLGMQRSRILSTQAVLQRTPTIRADRLSGGVSYFDAQFDDARLALAMMQAVQSLGGVPLNYVRVDRFVKANDRISGLSATDVETGRSYDISARVVINATGIFTDDTRQLDQPDARPMLKVSRGSHIVVDRSFLPGETAIIIPSTDDGRVVFIIPWHGSVLIGTTDIPAPEPVLDPSPLPEEVDFLMEHATRYLARKVTVSDIRSMFCGLRPLVVEDPEESTAQMSRDHVIRTSPSGLITLTGGKWTTYRKMASDTVDTAIREAGLDHRPTRTESLPLTGNEQDSPARPQSTASVTEAFIQQAVRQEQARTVEDILSRRCRLLLLDAQAAIDLAPKVASVLSSELQRDITWEQSQVTEFTALARTYLPG